MALEKLSPEDDSRRRELTELRQQLEAVPPPRWHLITSLPVELVVTIFTLSNNPTVIAHVCHEWRAFAHSQPAIWRNLVLNAAPSGGVPVLQKINEWHKWSSGWIAELHIRKSLGTALFPSGVGKAPDRSGMYDDVIAALRRLDLTKLKECHTQDMDLGLFLPALLGGGNYDGKNLERLSSLCKCSHFLNVPFGCGTLSWQSLRSLSLTGLLCEWAELSMSMRCLTSFEYKIYQDHGSFKDFHQFLHANASTLEKLVVVAERQTFGTSFQSTDPPEPLTLARLHHLELNGVLPFHHGNLSLPSIRILRISWLKEIASLLSILLEDGGSTSFEELVEFTIPGGLVGPQILSAALLRAPKLKILRCSDFDCVVVADTLSQKPCTALLRDPSTQQLVSVQLPVLCPALSVLDFTWSRQLKADQVVRIIKERIALAASEEAGRYQLPGPDGGDRRVSFIQTLTVDGCFQPEQDKFPWFEENVPDFSCIRYCQSDMMKRDS